MWREGGHVDDDSTRAQLSNSFCQRVGERSFAWLSHYRRLNAIFQRSKDHTSSRSLRFASISILARRLRRLVTEDVSARLLQTDSKTQGNGVTVRADPAFARGPGMWRHGVRRRNGNSVTTPLRYEYACSGFPDDLLFRPVAPSTDSPVGLWQNELKDVHKVTSASDHGHRQTGAARQIVQTAPA